MRVLFSPEARAEFEDAARYYDEQRQGLGDELRREMRNFLSQLRRSPQDHPPRAGWADAAREIAAQDAAVPVWPEFSNAEDAELRW